MIPGSRRAPNIWGVREIDRRLSLLCPAFSYPVAQANQASSIGNIYESTPLVYQRYAEVQRAYYGFLNGARW
jgi:hypothetical protein